MQILVHGHRLKVMVYRKRSESEKSETKAVKTTFFSWKGIHAILGATFDGDTLEQVAHAESPFELNMLYS